MTTQIHESTAPIQPGTSSATPTAHQRDGLPTSTLVVLIGAAAIPPLSIDMYLPSVPEISAVFGVGTEITQLTLTLFLLMLGLGQLVAGPISDAIGRRKPLLLGMILFITGSILAALTPSIGILIAARLLQGAGGSITVVVSNSIVRDYASGRGATKAYSVLISAIGIAPIIAPTIGGFLDETAGWRSVFWFLTALGAITLVGILVKLPESLPENRRHALELGKVFRTYATLVVTGSFVLPAFALICAFCLLFTYIGGASYVYQGSFGLSSSVFGIAFGATGIAMLLGNIVIGKLVRRFSSPGLAHTGAALASLGAPLALAAALTNSSFALFLPGIVIMVLGLGLCEPTLMGDAMNAAPRAQAGQAAAFLGAAQFLFGAGATFIVAPIAESGALAWAVTLAICALLALILARSSHRMAQTSQI